MDINGTSVYTNVMQQLTTETYETKKNELWKY